MCPVFQEKLELVCVCVSPVCQEFYTIVCQEFCMDQVARREERAENNMSWTRWSDVKDNFVSKVLYFAGVKQLTSVHVNFP